MTVLSVDVRVGETIRFSGEGKVAVTVKSKSGRLSRLEVEADPTVSIETPQRTSIRDVVKAGVTKP